MGFCTKKKGENEIAQEWYQKAKDAYDIRIEDGQFVINSKVNQAFLLFFTENKESAMIAFDNLKKEYPENKEVEFSERIFTDFDKKEFLNEFHH